MKVRYEFDNGEVSVVEVTEDIGEMIMSSRREEHAQDVREHRHCYSLDAIDYEGLEFADYNTPESEYEKEIRDAEIAKAFDKLTSTQRRRLAMLAEGMSLHEIAELEEASFYAVWKSIDQAKTKFQKNYSKKF